MGTSLYRAVARDERGVDSSSVVYANLGSAFAHLALPLVRDLSVTLDPVSVGEALPLGRLTLHAFRDYGGDGIL